MRKEYTFTMSRQIMELAQKPLRSKVEAIILLLNTVRMVNIDEPLWSRNVREEQVIISINKMSRIFYLFENKWFSMQFPFFVRKYEKSKDIFFYNSDIRITPMLLSHLLTIFEIMQNKPMDLDLFFEILTEPDFTHDDCSVEEIWIIVSYLLQHELGYLRYDVDLEHECRKMHPLYHLDICLNGAVSYKLGIAEKLDFEDFRNILDVTTQCWYLKSPSF